MDPVGLLRDLLLGRADKATGAIRPGEIRVSSGLVLGGVCLGLFGFAAIALAQYQQGPPQGLRELGGVLGAAGLVVLLWGILAGLPSHRGLRVLGLGGAAVAAIGMLAFVWAYPQNWGKAGVVDHAVPVLATYVTGLVLLVAATFASLVADFVLRLQVKGKLRGELGRDPTDDEIQRDIDEAWRKHKVTWGGMTEDKGKHIRVRVDAMPAEFEAVQWKLGREVVATGERKVQVDMAVDKLLDFRGGRNRTGSSSDAGLSTAVDALRGMRTAKEEAPPPSLWERIFHRRKLAHRAPPGFELGPPGGPPLP